MRFERQLKQTLGQLHAEQQRTIGVCNEKDHQVARTLLALCIGILAGLVSFFSIYYVLLKEFIC